MDDRHPDAPPPSPAAEPPREGTVHPGTPPRLRRVGRTVAVLAVLAFVTLLTVLSAKYSHEIGQPAAEDGAASAVAPSSPLSADRIEEFARRRLQEQLRAAKPAPPPPPLDAYQDASAPGTELPPPPPPTIAPPSPAAPPRPASRTALDAPLVPAIAAPGSLRTDDSSLVNAVRPPTPDLPSLEEFLASAPTRPPLPGSAPSRSSTRELSPPPEPLDRRTLDIPRPGVVTLNPALPPAQPTLFARTTIPLVLTHDVSTDVPGPIRAYVTRDIYDSSRAETLLVPRGTLAIGHQAAHAAAGDQRVLIYWTELKYPNGLSDHLPDVLGGSQDGTAGVLGDVDNHWWSRVGSAIGLSLVGAGIQLSQPQQRTSVQGFAPDEGQVVAQQLGLELGRLSQEILRRGVNRPPTIYLRAGERLSLILARDLAFVR